MSSRKVLGILLLGIGAIAYIARRTVDKIQVIFDSIKVHEIRPDSVLFQVNLFFYNPLFVDVTINSFSGQIYIMGRYNAHVEAELDQVLLKRTKSSYSFYFKSTPQELGNALWENIQTGDIRTLAIRFDGYVEVNGVKIPVKKDFSYDELFSKSVQQVSGLHNELLHASGRNQFLKFGNNADVLNFVNQCYKKWREQPRAMVQGISDLPVEVQCRAIFDHVLENVQYCVDEPGAQYIKSPARLIADGKGDCKSMTIFIASCLHCLGIPHIIRFVNFDGDNQYTHVYPIAIDGDNMIILDAVERDPQGNPIYNYARPCVRKKDIRYSE